MMGRQAGDQSQLFYLFNLEERIPARHLLRRINPIVTRVLADLPEKLKPFYSETRRVPGLDNQDPNPDRKPPKVISPTDPCSAWTAKANKRMPMSSFAVIIDVEATPARTYDEVAATRTMIDRTENAFGVKPERLTADTAYGTGKLLAWLLDKGITPHIPVWERYQRTDGMFPRTDFAYDAERDIRTANL
jgi:hypothetical protein